MDLNLLLSFAVANAYPVGFRHLRFGNKDFLYQSFGSPSKNNLWDKVNGNIGSDK